METAFPGLMLPHNLSNLPILPNPKVRKPLCCPNGTASAGPSGSSQGVRYAVRGPTSQCPSERSPLGAARDTCCPSGSAEKGPTATTCYWATGPLIKTGVQARRGCLRSGGEAPWSIPGGFAIDWAGEGEWKITLDVFRDLGLALGLDFRVVRLHGVYPVRDPGCLLPAVGP